MLINEGQMRRLISKETRTRPEEQEDKIEREMHKEFVVAFNKEAKKQRSKWFAEIEGLPKYSFLHISKKGTWFKPDISFHISCYKKDYFSFIDDDYIVTYSGYEADRIAFFRKSVVEFMDILKSIPQKVFMMPEGEHSKLNQRITEIKEDIIGLGAK